MKTLVMNSTEGHEAKYDILSIENIINKIVTDAGKSFMATVITFKNYETATFNSKNWFITFE